MNASKGLTDPAASEITGRELRGRGWNVSVAPQFVDDFPADRFRNYASFVHVEGRVIKDEPRTRVVQFAGRPDGSDAPGDYVLKHYRNPHLTGLRIPPGRTIAEREFRNLALCRELGVPAVEPVAFGADWRVPGLLRSSLLVTRFEDESVDLRRWLRRRQDEIGSGDRQLGAILASLGAIFRKVHERRVFLVTPNLRNILLAEGSEERGEPRLSFIDVPCVSRASSSRAARRAQTRDLGIVFGPLLRVVDNVKILEPFLEAYLPDPLESDEGALRARVEHAARAHNNQTPFSRLRNRVHKSWMWVMRGGRRARDVRLRDSRFDAARERKSR